MNTEPKTKWYFTKTALVIAFLCVGPFAMPLAWFNPRFSRKDKILLSLLMIVVTYFLTVLMRMSLNSISSAYQLMLQ
ncbi:MAG: hypothetical protein PHP46_06360 [Candidatus Omnitrophica bacterium]|nr:hypothetical protein [Candidatus Omnitrophota bacterium]